MLTPLEKISPLWRMHVRLCYSKYDQPSLSINGSISSISTTWVLLRNAESKAPPHTSWIILCIITRLPRRFTGTLKLEKHWPKNECAQWPATHNLWTQPIVPPNSHDWEIVLHDVERKLVFLEVYLQLLILPQVPSKIILIPSVVSKLQGFEFLIIFNFSFLICFGWY